ncbi:MAG: hypothetical protein AB7U34_00220 [Novosphingobium sp.]
MRVALLSIVRPSDCGSGGYRGFIEFAGRSVARRQLDLALALGCERIVFVTDYLHQPLLALQHICETAGARFNTVSGARAFSGLIKANDELLVLADSLVPLSDKARQRLDKGPCVLTLPCEEGIAAGFERIDLNSAWAGALFMPGHAVERLSDLPSDCDVPASLLRIALQVRVPEVSLGSNVLSDGDWLLLSSPAQAEKLEATWLRRHVPTSTGRAPGHAIAGWFLSTFAVSLARRSKAGVQMLWLAFALMLFAAGVGGWVWLPLGLVFIGLAYLALKVASGLAAVEAATGSGQPASSRWEMAETWLLDFVLSGLLAAGIFIPESGWAEAGLSALVLPAALRVLAGLAPAEWRSLAEDRFTFSVILSAVAFGSILALAVHVLTLCALVAGLYFLARISQKQEITRL